MDYLSWVERSWPLLGRLMQGHTAVYRASNGVLGHHVPGLPPMLLLDHLGAKSAKRRTSPLVYTVDGEKLVLVASKGGYPKHPGWYHNLLANPETTVQVGAHRKDVHAHVADAAERKRMWPMVLGTYRGYADYQQRTKRQIPLVVLGPR
jgi:deazaflavin-dependent oxidoreductase (nitroreductase family)